MSRLGTGALALLLVGCADSATNPSLPNTLVLDGPDSTRKFNVAAGSSIQLTARATNAQGNVVDVTGLVSFVSRMPGVATVDGTGKVTVQASGTSYIIASLTAGGATLLDSVAVVGWTWTSGTTRTHE